MKTFIKAIVVGTIICVLFTLIAYLMGMSNVITSIAYFFGGLNGCLLTLMLERKD